VCLSERNSSAHHELALPRHIDVTGRSVRCSVNQCSKYLCRLEHAGLANAMSGPLPRWLSRPQLPCPRRDDSITLQRSPGIEEQRGVPGPASPY
jgi:hypothetical protein